MSGPFLSRSHQTKVWYTEKTFIAINDSNDENRKVGQRPMGPLKLCFKTRGIRKQSQDILDNKEAASSKQNRAAKALSRRKRRPQDEPMKPPKICFQKYRGGKEEGA